MHVSSVLPGAAVGAAAVAVLVLAAAPAHAAAPGSVPVPGCGVVLTSDAHLADDLTCPSGDGLHLGPGVTLDLRGHVLRGAGGTGVTVAEEGDMRVVGGTISGWGRGIFTGSAEEYGEVAGALTVERVTLRGNRSAVVGSPDYAGSSKDLLVDRSTLVGNRYGFYSLGATATFRRTTFSANGTGVEVGPSRVVLEDSRVQGNDVGLACDRSSCTLAGTTLVANGVALRGSWMTDLRVDDSTFLGNDVGIDATDEHVWTRVDASRFTDNGTAVVASTQMAVHGSTFRRNDVGFTTEDGEYWQADGYSVLADNRFLDGGDGVVTDEEIDLRGNSAVGNRGWGIHALHAVDLGGNTARGNGNEPQCVGVVCGP
ncbi:right-handed parallel beta-helix repeat-containing protein [Cellulomonas sp. 179-A 9B4 NHS]|uniref:right-handed parallel beta-helix repeat-containing protein n=1 Tax=Cellulomonas sp. 179-A 9B4 NHS TaxID=3142379 RepID=UPI00399FFF40